MPAEEGFKRMRSAMVERDLRGRGITDERVLEVMGRIPRQRFVGATAQGEAYADHPLPIGHGQTISQPFMVALMSQSLNLTGVEKVLEIGTGSGYQTAILSELAAQVYTMDRIEALVERAGSVLSELGCTNVHYRAADGSIGWEENAPFDRIMVTCAAPEVPPSLKAQLAPGGLMVIPVGDPWQQLLRIHRAGGDEWRREEVTSCVFVPLIGREGFKDK